MVEISELGYTSIDLGHCLSYRNTVLLILTNTVMIKPVMSYVTRTKRYLYTITQTSCNRQYLILAVINYQQPLNNCQICLET